MAAPTAPTSTTIVQEGLKKSGLSSGTTQFTALQTRGIDEWMEEIKNDIWERAKDLKILQTSSQVILSRGDSVYPLPSDFSSLINITLLSGTTSGTAQTGGATSITLDANVGFSEDQIVGQNILIQSGTSVGELNQCVAYSATTQIATMADTWTVTPDNTSVYLIVDTEDLIDETPLWDLNKQNLPSTLGTPFEFARIGTESGVSNIKMYYTPDKTYGLRVDYFADLTKSDLTSTVLVTAYRRWRNAFITGIVYKSYEDRNDDRETMGFQKYDLALGKISAREQNFSEMSQLQQKVVDR